MNDPAIQRQLQQTQAAAQMQVEISVLLDSFAIWQDSWISFISLGNHTWFDRQVLGKKNKHFNLCKGTKNVLF